MAISLEHEDGQRFKALFERLHGRRLGAAGTRRYARDTIKSNGVRPGLNLLDAYHRGDPPLTGVHDGWRPFIYRFIRMGRLNVASLLVESTQNRMGLRDFQTNAADDELGDVYARNLMDANELSMGSRDVHDWMLSLADSYTLTQPPTSTFKWSRITAEDPRFMITVDDPLTNQPRFGLKITRDEWDTQDDARVFFPDGRIKLARKRGATTLTDVLPRFSPAAWEWIDAEEQTTPNRRIPIVHFQNKHGVGEFEEHLDHLDRINDKIFNEWWTGKIQAFRQRAVKNLPDRDQKTGEIIDYTDMFTASPDEMWRVPADVDFWESAPIDMGPMVGSIQKDLERLAAVKQQPLHTITPDAANGSAEGASLMREEHLYKIEDRIDRVKYRWAATMANAFAYMTGDNAAEYHKRADATQIKTIWGPTERYSLQQKASAAAQLNAGSDQPALPQDAIWTDVLQYPPSRVADLREMAGRSLIFQTPGGVPTAPPGNPGSPGTQPPAATV